MVKRYHESFPSFSYGFDSRYPLQFFFALPPFGLLGRGFVPTPGMSLERERSKTLRSKTR
jgi:hypothetical protein